MTLFPSKGFYLSLKKLTLPAVWFFTFMSNLHKVMPFFDIRAVNTNVTLRHRS